MLYNNIKKQTWENLVLDPVNIRSSKLEIIKDWLEEFKATTHVSMLKVWNQTNMTPEMWANYKILFDKAVLIEQLQMKELEKELKAKWKTLTAALKRKEPDGTAEHTEQEKA